MKLLKQEYLKLKLIIIIIYIMKIKKLFLMDGKIHQMKVLKYEYI